MIQIIFFFLPGFFRFLLFNIGTQVVSPYSGEQALFQGI